jgi:outer membrane receptor protein involved in Fe transport
MKRFATGLGAVVAGVLAVGTAVAQSAGSEKLEEVVVTAQRRSESLQEVPLSITALSAASLEQKAVTSFFDYAGKVPSLAFANTGDGSGTARTISIRGISGDGTTGFYIDETPVPDSIDPRVVDVERIEVLRGPQGTLYGARSMGGTVRLITAQPNFDEFSGRVRVNGSKTAEADNANYGIDGAFNAPLAGGRAAVRGVAFYQRDAGFLKRHFLANPADAANLPPAADPTNLGGLPTATRKDVGRTESWGGALSLSVKLGDAWSVTPRVMYQKSKANGFLYADAGTYPVPAPDPSVALPPVDMRPRSYVQNRFYDLPESSTDEWTLGSITLKYEGSSFSFLSSTSYFDRTVDETEDQTDFLWQNLESPFDGLPLGDINDPNAPAYHAVPIPSTIRELKQIHRFVQEFRVTSKLDGPFQYVAGLFFSDTRGRLPYAGYYPAAIAPGISQTAGFVVTGLEAFGLPIPVNPANPDEIFGSDSQTIQREPAIYGELSYQFTPQLKGTVGARAYKVKTETGGYLEGIAFGGARLTDPTTSTTDNGVNPKVALEYKISPDQMVFGSISKGFRPGGLVPSIPGNANSDPLGCFAQLQNLGYTSAEQTKSFKPDKLWNYEFGGKTSWADNRVTVNGSLFYIKWDQIQQLVALRCGFQFRANAGAADVKGFDLEVHARPVPNLDLSAGVGYQRARITKESQALPDLHKGDRVYQVPDWTGNASATYTWPLSAGHSLVGNVSWSYTGDVVSASVDTHNPRIRPSFTLLDARFAYSLGNYEFALVGKNLTNEYANLGDNRSLAAETILRPRLVVNTPRTIGLEFLSHF